jgi:hypothetical protein
MVWRKADNKKIIGHVQGTPWFKLPSILGQEVLFNFNTNLEKNCENGSARETHSWFLPLDWRGLCIFFKQQSGN